MAEIRLEGVRKTWPGGHEAVRDVDLTIADGELLVLVGPSGCGKSTLLRLVAGLETPSAGTLSIGGREVTHLPPQDRDVAMVFQSYALYPHRSVRDNLAFPLRMRRVAPGEIARRVQEAARVLGIDTLLDRMPRQLSGGQRQRVALGRAMVREPSAFLLDEPLSNLDPALRVRTRAELARLHRRLATTMLYVTHDQEEAMTLGDRIAVMHEGRLQQVASPLDVYRHPATAFVAGFIGSPAMNLLECSVVSADEGTELRGRSFRLTIPPPTPPQRPWSGAMLLGLRPHDVLVVPREDGDAVGRVEVLEPTGPAVLMHVTLAGGADEIVRVMTPADSGIRDGMEVGLRFPRHRVHVFSAESGTLLRSPGG
jgi:multiple sugar transport system ATP-binding protein